MTNIIIACAIIIGLQLYTLFTIYLVWKSLNNDNDEQSSTDITDSKL